MVLDEVMNAATPRRLDLAAAFLQCEALASGIRSASLLYRLLTNEVIEHLHCLSVTFTLLHHCNVRARKW